MREGFSEANAYSMLQGAIKQSFCNGDEIIYQKLEATGFENLLVNATYDGNNNLVEGFLSDDFVDTFNINIAGDKNAFWFGNKLNTDNFSIKQLNQFIHENEDIGVSYRFKVKFTNFNNNKSYPMATLSLAMVNDRDFSTLFEYAYDNNFTIFLHFNQEDLDTVYTACNFVNTGVVTSLLTMDALVYGKESDYYNAINKLPDSSNEDQKKLKSFLPFFDIENVFANEAKNQNEIAAVQ
jgi:hypothetical protein